MRVRILKNPFSGDYTDTQAVKGITSSKLLKSLDIEPCTCQVFDDGKPVGQKHRLKGPVVIQIAPAGWEMVAYVVIAAVIGAAAGAVVSHLMRENIPDYSKVQTASSLRGGSNQARPGQKVPILLGTHRIFADVASLPYSSYSGNQQFLHQLFCWGYDNTVIANADIKVGDTLLSKLSGVSIEDTIGSIYPSRCIETYIGIKLVKKNGEDPVYVERSTPSGTVSLRFGIMAPNGIYRYDDDNDRVASMFSISYQWRPAGGAWSETTTIVRSLNTDEYREMVQVMVSGSADKSYDLKVWRSADEGSGASDVDTLYLDMMDSFTEDPVSGSTLPIANASRYRLSAIKVQATNQINGVLERVNAIAHARYRDYSGVGTGPESWVVAETENPASALLYILTDPKVNPRPMEDGDIVWEDFEAWHTFCEAQGYTIGALVSADITIDSIADQILATGRAEKRQHGGMFGIRIDQSNPYVAQMFTPRNSWGFSMDRDYSTKPSNLVVKFINKDLDYVEVERTISFTAEGSIVYDTPQDGPTEEISIPLVTDVTQVSKLAAYVLMALHARVRSYSWNADIEGLLCVPGDVVLVANDGVFFGFGEGRITTISCDTAGLPIRVKLDTPMTMEVGQTYALEIRTAAGIVKCSVNNTGKTTKWLTLTEALDHPLEEGALAAFGLLDAVTHKVLIEKIQPDGLRHCKISAVDYAEEIYSAEGVIPPYNAGVSRYREGLISPGTGARQPVGILPPPGRPGLTGDSARLISLFATTTVIRMSRRGILLSDDILLTVVRENIPSVIELLWVVPAGVTLEPVEGQPDLRNLLVASVLQDDVEISVAATYEGITYTAPVSISKVYESTAERYLGMYDSMPTETPEGYGLIDGDWVLWVDEELPSDYHFGWLYEYRAGMWYQSTDSVKVIGAQVDAMALARDSGKVVYTALLVAELILAQDLLVRGTLKSTNYSETGGVPTKGWLLDGPNDLLRTVYMEAFKATIYGDLIHDALETQEELPGVTHLATSPPLSLYRGSELYAAFPFAEGWAWKAAAGSLGGKTIVRATKVPSQSYLLYDNSFAGSSKTITSSDESLTYTIPAGIGPVRVDLLVSMSVWAYITIYLNGAVIGARSSTASYPLIFNAEAGDILTVTAEYRVPYPYQPLVMTISRCNVTTRSTYIGPVVGFDDNTMESLGTNSSDSFWSFQFAFTSPLVFDYTDVATRRSGTDITSIFIPSIPSTWVGVTSGQISVDGFTADVTRIRRVGTSIEFETLSGSVIVDSFNEGTVVGTYVTLAMTAITVVSQDGALLTKYLIPMVDALYDLGSLGKRYRELHLSSGINTGQGVNKVYPQNQALRTIDDVAHNSLQTNFFVLDDSSPIDYRIINALPGVIAINSDITSIQITSSSYYKVKEILSRASGVVLVKFLLKGYGGEYSYSSYARIYKNGVAVGTQRESSNSAGITFTENIAVEIGDYLQIYARNQSNSYRGYVSDLVLQIQNGFQAFEPRY